MVLSLSDPCEGGAGILEAFHSWAIFDRVVGGMVTSSEVGGLFWAIFEQEPKCGQYYSGQ